MIFPDNGMKVLFAYSCVCAREHIFKISKQKHPLDYPFIWHNKMDFGFWINSCGDIKRWQLMMSHAIFQSNLFSIHRGSHFSVLTWYSASTDELFYRLFETLVQSKLQISFLESSKGTADKQTSTVFCHKPFE